MAVRGGRADKLAGSRTGVQPADVASERSTECTSDAGSAAVGRQQGSGGRVRQGHGGGTSSKLQKVAVVVLEDEGPAPGFSLRGCVLGEGGRNLGHIAEQTRVHVLLAGRGAATRRGKESEKAKDKEEGPMRIMLSGAQASSLADAVELTRELVEHVRTKHEQAKQLAMDRKGKGRGKGKGRCKVKENSEHAVSAGMSKFAKAEKERLEQAADRVQKEAQKLSQEATALKSQGAEMQKAAPAIAEVLTNEVKDVARLAVAAGAARQDNAVDVAKAFWEALDRSRAAVHAPEAVAVRKEAKQAQDHARKLFLEARTLEQKAKAFKREGTKLISESKLVSTNARPCAGRCCSLFAAQACPFDQGKCPRGSHEVPSAPTQQEVFMSITRAKTRLLQQKWTEAGGSGELRAAWQVRNPRLDFLFRGAEANFFESSQQTPDVIDAWHGSAEENIFSIAVNGFDPSRRCGQAYGAGEYFAKNPMVSVAYARGGSFMFLCKLLLGKDGEDHTWEAGPQYYVIKQREGRMQVLPIFLVQFSQSRRGSELMAQLKTSVVVRDAEERGTLAMQQRGGLQACQARRDAGMFAEATRHLWLGWLDPALRFRDDDGVAEDVCAFLEGHAVEQVVPERNGARIGAFVVLREPIGHADFAALAARRYHGEAFISVDDAQLSNPRCRGKLCPRLAGPSRYCRGWNIRGHAAWQWGCAYNHPEDARPTHGVEYVMEAVRSGSAKHDEIRTEMARSMPNARIVGIKRVQNMALEKLYSERRSFIHEKQGFAVEKELWHGTSCEALPTLLKHGLQPPSDTRPADSCPLSGGKGLCTTLCGAGCSHCKDAHCWDRCHMYGLGVYLADVAAKSHQYVRKPVGPVYSMLRVRVCLGNPYLIEGNLLEGSAMHDTCWCQNPSEALESLAEEWSVTKGHDAYYVKGLSGKQKHGLGVFNNEYVVFQPYQILPLYQVDYVLS